MTEGQKGWIFLLIASICIFLIGMQGSLGVFVAILFSPSSVTTSETGTPATPTSNWTTQQYGGQAGAYFGPGPTNTPAPTTPTPTPVGTPAPKKLGKIQ